MTFKENLIAEAHNVHLEAFFIWKCCLSVLVHVPGDLATISSFLGIQVSFVD